VSGLIQVKEILQDIEGIAFVYFDEKDVVRHRLVQEIIKAYDRHQSANSDDSRQSRGQVTSPQRQPSKPRKSLTSDQPLDISESAH
jgi:phosphate starvation-inducible PhoH-like protein